jgi:hypothetical protein
MPGLVPGIHVFYQRHETLDVVIAWLDPAIHQMEF